MNSGDPSGTAGRGGFIQDADDMVTVHAIKSAGRPVSLETDCPVFSAVPAGRARARRRWVLRSVVTLVMGAACVGLVTVVHRDRTAVQAAVAGIQELGQQIRLSVERWGRLPASVELKEDPPRIFYLDDAVRLYVGQAGGSVIVAVGPKVDLVLLRDGRAILNYEQGRVRAEWVDETGFKERWSRQEAAVRAFEQELRSRPPVLP